jgi:hypothetical protein
MDPPGIETILARLGELTQFDGFCNIDWIWAENGTIFLSELNPRPTPGYLLHPDIRAALVAAVRDRFAGAPVQLHKASGHARGHLFPERFSYAATNGGASTWLTAIASLRRAAWDEPKLVLAQMRQAIKMGYDVREGRKNAPAR